jgi:hypothetical protein
VDELLETRQSAETPTGTVGSVIKIQYCNAVTGESFTDYCEDDEITTHEVLDELRHDGFMILNVKRVADEN